jgi:hypothetical protein
MKGIASSSKQQNENNPALQQHGRRRLSCDGNLKPSDGRHEHRSSDVMYS